jgi:peroxiredoxin Q/BCP
MTRAQWLLLGGALVLLALIVVPALFIRQSQKKAEAARLKVGDRAPDFTLSDQNRKPVQLSSFLGKKSVVLAFYVKASTPG